MSVAFGSLLRGVPAALLCFVMLLSGIAVGTYLIERPPPAVSASTQVAEPQESPKASLQRMPRSDPDSFGGTDPIEIEDVSLEPPARHATIAGEDRSPGNHLEPPEEMRPINGSPALGLIPLPIGDDFDLNPHTIDLALVDDLIEQASFEEALELLEQFEQRSSGVLLAYILLRKGICAESLGDVQGALDAFRTVLHSHRASDIADAATIAAARLYARAGHDSVSNSLLMNLFLAREAVLNSRAKAELLHLLASCVAQAAAASDHPTSLLDDSVFLTPSHNYPADESIRQWRSLTGATSTNTSQDGIRIRSVAATANGNFASLHLPVARISDLLEQICDQTGWSLSLSESARRSLRGRTTSCDCRDLPLDLVLDSLLSPHELEWRLTGRTLSIVHHAERQGEATQADTHHGDVPGDSALGNPLSREHEWEMADRFLQFATSFAPEHISAPQSFVETGVIAAQHGDLARAIRLFEMASHLFPRSKVLSVAAFNRGKCQMQTEDRSGALESFQRVVDSSSGLTVDGLAYLYIGRILLEDDRAPEAVMPAMRGMLLLEGTEYEGSAALLLSAAHLMSGNPMGANEVLLSHRQVFEPLDDATEFFGQSDVRISQANQAAFLSSLARFYGTTRHQQMREARALLSALTNARPERMFGGHSDYLVGIAFAAIGLDSEQRVVFQRCLNNSPSFPLQEKMRLVLAGDKTVPLAPFTVRNGGLRDTKPARGEPEDRADAKLLVNRRTMFAKAEQAYRLGNHAEALRTCSAILNAEIAQQGPGTGPGDGVRQIHSSALRLMGQIYQNLGEHEAAISCFSGTIPKIALPDQSEETTPDAPASGIPPSL